MMIERFERSLLNKKFFGLFPCTFSLNSLIDNFFIDFDVDLVNKGGELLIDECDIVFGILSGKVDILQNFLIVDVHLEMENRLF